MLSPERYLEPGGGTHYLQASLDLVLPLVSSHRSSLALCQAQLWQPRPKTLRTAPLPLPSTVQVAANRCQPPWRARRLGRLRHGT